MSEWYRIERIAPVPSLREFAELHGLTLVVRQRPTVRGAPENYYAKFENVEVVDGRMLVGTTGNGQTPEESIVAYAAAIAGKQLVFRAMSPEHRKEFYAPQQFSPEAR